MNRSDLSTVSPGEAYSISTVFDCEEETCFEELQQETGQAESYPSGENRPNPPKGKEHFPSIHRFSGVNPAVSFRVLVDGGMRHEKFVLFQSYTSSTSESTVFGSDLWIKMKR